MSNGQRTIPLTVEELDEEVGRWGACRSASYPTSLFYSDDPKDQAKAKAVCVTCCSVTEECLELATRRREKFGVWGGMTTNERDPRGWRRRKALQREQQRRRREEGRS